LLQVLDDGRLTDGQGRVVNFTNAIIIMTSNIGSHMIQDLGIESARDKVLEALREHFRPEFLNRVDEVVMFSALTRQDLMAIVDIQLRRLETLAMARGIGLDVTRAARERLTEEGFDPVYGARPLKRVIQRRLQNELAMALLEGRFQDGDTARFDLQAGALTLERVPAQGTTAGDGRGPAPEPAPVA
ncbi:MAG: AAA family ATPase, partial [Anaerolineae bacterium]